MGAFDAELYQLGYRFLSREKQTKKSEFIGPIWRGYCLGNCQASICVACQFNRRISKEELLKKYKLHEENQDSLIKFGLHSRAEKEHIKFTKMYPNYKGSKDDKTTKS